ncbi:unnamed protein product [Effrenium voratum]|uniref:R3H domain-containing protein n=1 Tax=Effrenium voratum TaxID=2562239 RepID=A0AA36MPC8_9DINO|nr:unnamed protein product [Effrenium voratum]CAJ1446000.1 unnamed protein product [Effrenium voratum]
MRRARFLLWSVVPGVFLTALAPSNSFLPLPSFGKTDRTNSKQSDSKVISELAVWSGDSPDARRLRSAIESILREQEALREETPAVTGGAWFSVLSAVGLALLAQTSWAGPAALPVIASAIFSYTSVAESFGTKSVGLGRCSFSQALADAAEQERALAAAEGPKALLPFGAGCTAIFAAVCVTLKIFEEDPANLAVALAPAVGWPSKANSLPAMLDWLFCFASVLGAVATNDKALSVISKVRPQLRNPLQEEDDNDEPRELDDGDIEVGLRSRVLLAVFSAIACFLPLLLFKEASTASLVAAADEICVIVSASAAAQTAFSFLIAEKFFADAERRVAAQSRQAALSELFFAQATADSAGLAANSALSASSLGVASVVTEFSKGIAACAVWPAVASTFQSTVSAVTSRAEADAAWLENQSSKRASEGMEADMDTVAAAAREFQQLQRDFFLDEFTENIRNELKALEVGQVREFRGLSRDQRRKVHLVAAEQGMCSESFGLTRQRMARRVVVTNPKNSSSTPVRSFSEGIGGDMQNWLETLQEEIKAIQKTVLQSGWKENTLAGALVFGSVASPLVLGQSGAELFLPLATGTVGLCSAWQETAGKGAVANAKRQTAVLMSKEARAETFLGRAQIAYAAFPTDVAIATLATTATVLSYQFPLTFFWRAVAMSTVIPAYTACSVAMHRRRKVERFVAAAMRCVDATPIPTQRRIWKQRCWLLPLISALVIPCAPPGRATVACAAFAAEIALAMAESSLQLANAQGSIARASRVVATADAWSQLAQFSARALPARTSLAVVSTLMATALVEFSLPLCSLFPLLGAAVLARSYQLNRQAQRASAKLEEEFMDMQVLRKVEPWPRLRELSASEPVQPSARWKSTPGVLAPLNLADKMLRTLVSLKNVWDDRGPADAYKPPPADQAVRSVQANLNEIRSLTRFTRSSWFRTLSLVGFVALASVLQPWVLFSSSEVVLPVAGALLTIFVAASESDARQSASASKVKAADLKSACSTMEEFAASAMQFRSYLLAFAGCTAATCVLSLVSIKPGALSLRYSWLRAVQQYWSLGLVVFHVVAAACSTFPLKAVLLWTSRVKLDVPASRSSIYPQPLAPGAVVQGLPKGHRWRDLFCHGRWSWLQPLLAAFPCVLLALFPSSRSFEERSIASTAASSLVVAATLCLAERALYRTELLISGRRISFALTDSLANEAEQQSALLPVATAATIAVSAAVTFGVELNPFAASALALLQAVTWVLASRKALEARFGSDAAIQVATVTDGRVARPGRPQEDVSPKRLGQWRSWVSMFSRPT